MTEEKREKVLFHLKWKHIKIIVPIIVSILSGTFTFGYFIQNEVNKVANARLKIEVDKLNEKMDRQVIKTNNLENQIKILKSNLLFFKIDRNYIQSYSDYRKNPTSTNLQKWILSKKQYVKYLIMDFCQSKKSMSL